jgi:quercetin dioxygenase-like cupin family protein
VGAHYGDALGGPGAGEMLTRPERLDRRAVVLLVEREEISVTHSWYAAGERGPGPHVHREHTDAFYVLGGELTFGLGPAVEPVRVAAGGFVAVPANVVHSFANEGRADARFLNIHTPDKGFAAYLRALRDGEDASFDSFDPPAGGGRPASDALIVRPTETGGD